MWRVPASRASRSVPHCLGRRESLDQRLFHRPAPVVGIAHCHNGFQPRSAVPESGERRSAALRQQFCRSRLGGWDADFAPRPQRRHGMQVGDWLSQLRVLAPRVLMASARSLLWTVESRNPCTSSRASVMKSAVCRSHCPASLSPPSGAPAATGKQFGIGAAPRVRFAAECREGPLRNPCALADSRLQRQRELPTQCRTRTWYATQSIAKNAPTHKAIVITDFNLDLPCLRVAKAFRSARQQFCRSHLGNGADSDSPSTRHNQVVVG